jgi:hypothetical protein
LRTLATGLSAMELVLLAISRPLRRAVSLAESTLTSNAWLLQPRSFVVLAERPLGNVPGTVGEALGCLVTTPALRALQSLWRAILTISRTLMKRVVVSEPWKTTALLLHKPIFLCSLYRWDTAILLRRIQAVYQSKH